jgi:NAD-dependent deacetylase
MTSAFEPLDLSAPPPELLAHLRGAQRVAVLTGAGMSAESGIPTFRDALEGMWAKFDPQVLATAAGFRRDPALVWSWYESRRLAVSRAAPNAGHVALCEMAKLSWIEDMTIVTQNVDDLHERAGSCHVHHLHGSLFASCCFDCARPHTVADATAAHGQDAEYTAPPRCQACGEPIRPGVVWFGENLPQAPWAAAMACIERADVMLVVGTSGQVQPAALLPEEARRLGCEVWVINPDVEASVHAQRVWSTTAAQGLPLLLTHLISHETV